MQLDGRRSGQTTATHCDSPQRLRPLPCSVFSGCCTSRRAWPSNYAAFRRTPATQLGARHWALWKMTRSFEWAAQPHSTRERSEPNDLGLWDVRSAGRLTKNDVVAGAEKVSEIFSLGPSIPNHSHAEPRCPRGKGRENQGDRFRLRRPFAHLTAPRETCLSGFSWRGYWC